MSHLNYATRIAGDCAILHDTVGYGSTLIHNCQGTDSLGLRLGGIEAESHTGDLRETSRRHFPNAIESDGVFHYLDKLPCGEGDDDQLVVEAKSAFDVELGYVPFPFARIGVGGWRQEV